MGFDEDRLARTLIVIVPNTYDYDGSADFDVPCLGIACCPLSAYAYPLDFRGMVQYWAGGRVFGHLADESVRYNSFFSPSSEVLSAQANGWYRNISVSGKASDTPSFIFIFRGCLRGRHGLFARHIPERTEQLHGVPDSILQHNQPLRNHAAHSGMFRRGIQHGHIS